MSKHRKTEEEIDIEYIRKRCRLQWNWLPIHEQLFHMYWTSYSEEKKEVILSKSNKEWLKFQKRHIDFLKAFNEKHKINGYENYIA